MLIYVAYMYVHYIIMYMYEYVMRKATITYYKLGGGNESEAVGRARVVATRI